MVLLHDTKAGTAKPSAEFEWHWGTTVCPVKNWGPSDTFSNQVTCAHTDPQRSRGADFWRGWMKGLLGSGRRLRLLQVQPHLCHHTARGQQDPVQQGHLSHCNLQGFKSLVPQTTLPCQTAPLGFAKHQGWG